MLQHIKISVDRYKHTHTHTQNAHTHTERHTLTHTSSKTDMFRMHTTTQTCMYAPPTPPPHPTPPHTHRLTTSALTVGRPLTVGLGLFWPGTVTDTWRFVFGSITTEPTLLFLSWDCSMENDRHSYHYHNTDSVIYINNSAVLYITCTFVSSFSNKKSFYYIHGTEWHQSCPQTEN